MNNIMKSFEKIIITALLAMMTIVVALGTIELAVILGIDILNGEPYPGLLDIDEMLDIFGFFMMIIIGLELLDTIKVYLEGEEILIEVIFLVALTAVSRKVIILDVKQLDPMTLLGIAGLILSLAAGLYLVQATMRKHGHKPREIDRQASR